MSLLPQIVYEVPAETARVARAAFPKSNPYLRFADTLGVLYQDGDFAQLFPFIGQPALAPVRLALTTILQFADLLYEVVNRHYERCSLLITSNRAFKTWNEVFPNATCLATLLDRLTRHADITTIEGQSYRVRESEQVAAARRNQPYAEQ